MKLEHIAIWVEDLETIKNFYTRYFEATSNEKYTNSITGFSSYFLSFQEGGARLEIMYRKDIEAIQSKRGFSIGMAHIAINVGSQQTVDKLTNQLRSDGYTILGEPRITGDGYYESVILDPEGNCLEIVA